MKIGKFNISIVKCRAITVIFTVTALSIYSPAFGASNSNSSEESKKEIKAYNRSLKRDVKYVKRNYPANFKGVVAYANREAKGSGIESRYTLELQRQAMAFRDISEVLEEGTDKKMISKIEHALVRWNWRYGDPILGNSNSIDYYMAWMECMYKRQ